MFCVSEPDVTQEIEERLSASETDDEIFRENVGLFDEGDKDFLIYVLLLKRWYGGVVVWWCSGVVVWWCGGVVMWWLRRADYS